MRRLVFVLATLLTNFAFAASLSVDPHFLQTPVPNRSVMVCGLGLDPASQYGISFPTGPFTADQDPAVIFSGVVDGDHCIRLPSAGMDLPPGSAWHVALLEHRFGPERWWLVAESWVAIDIDPGSPLIPRHRIGLQPPNLTYTLEQGQWVETQTVDDGTGKYTITRYLPMGTTTDSHTDTPEPLPPARQIIREIIEDPPSPPPTPKPEPKRHMHMRW